MGKQISEEARQRLIKLIARKIAKSQQAEKKEGA